METKEAVLVFVYCKERTYQVLSCNDARKQHNDLINQGWKHTETIDACKFIEILYHKLKKNVTL